MLSFEFPWLLPLLAIVPFLVRWHVRWRSNAFDFPDADSLRHLTTLRSRLATWGPLGLRAVAVALVVFAAANPRVPDRRTPIRVEGIAILLLLDVSGSMNATDFDPTADPPLTRLDAAKQTFRAFVAGGELDGATFEGRERDQLGLIAFAALPEMVCPPTLNHGVLLQVLDRQQARSGLDAGTNIGDSLGLALASFQQMADDGDSRKKIVVLLSDGEHNKADGETLQPSVALQIAARLSVPVHTIDCGGNDSAAKPDEQRQRDEGKAILNRLAEATGGRNFAAKDLGELKDALAAIDGLERQPTTGPLYRRYHSLSPWLGLAALACFLAWQILERTIWQRIP